MGPSAFGPVINECRQNLPLCWPVLPAVDEEHAISFGRDAPGRLEGWREGIEIGPEMTVNLASLSRDLGI